MATDPLFNTEDYAEAIRKQVLEKDATILASAFSADGDCLICGNNQGRIAIWYLPKYFNTESQISASQRGPDLSFQAFDGAVYCIESVIMQHNIILISGGQFSIKGWSWSDIMNKISSKSQLNVKLLFELKNPMPTTPNAFNFLAETNAVSFDHSKSMLYSASGDNKAYAWDIERQSIVRSFEGHAAYLHCIKWAKNKQQLFTGSEDGTVRIWDPNVKEQISILDPLKGTSVKTQKDVTASTNNWISALDLDSSSEWLACGGGGKYISLWYLPMRHVTSYLPMLAPVTDVFFYEDSIVSAGLEDNVYTWKLNGSLVSRSPTSSRAVYSVKYNTAGRNKVMVAGGASNTVDVFYTFSRKAFSLLWNE